MPAAFHIQGSDRPRPASRATIFCDGTADESFRPGTDIELSHWMPNRTPVEVRADTSTEICLRFVELGAHDQYDLVVNNHADVDGVLSVFAIVEPRLASKHREAIVGAAAMGDFWAHGGGLAIAIFVMLTDVIDAGGENGDVAATYDRAFHVVRDLLAEATPPPEVDAARATLAASLDLVATGRVTRTLTHERFVSYRIPAAVVGSNRAAALNVPRFGAQLSSETLLLPQARNFHDAERIQLVSVEGEAGWTHDLWYPGYMWADTHNLWRAPGFEFANLTDKWFFRSPELTAAIDTLRQRETADGEWTAADGLITLETIPGRRFPVVLSFLGRDAQPADSSLTPDEVATILAPTFA
jgi:hypothetical protein